MHAWALYDSQLLYNYAFFLWLLSTFILHLQAHSKKFILGVKLKSYKQSKISYYEGYNGLTILIFRKGKLFFFHFLW